MGNGSKWNQMERIKSFATPAHSYEANQGRLATAYEWAEAKRDRCGLIFSLAAKSKQGRANAIGGPREDSNPNEGGAGPECTPPP